MQSFSDPKNQYQKSRSIDLWFLATDDVFTGPFSKNEVRAQIRDQKVSEKTRAWSPKSNSWNPIFEIEDFRISEIPLFESSTFRQGRSTGAPPPPPGARWDDFLKTQQVEAAQEIAQQAERQIAEAARQSAPQQSDNAYAAAEKEEAARDGVIARFKQQTMDLAHVPSRGIGRAFGAGLLVSVLLAMFTVKGRFKSVEMIEGLTPAQNQEALSVITDSSSATGSRTLLFPIGSVLQPRFLIVTNLKDHAEVLLKIEGVPDTLVGSFIAQFQTALKIKNGQATSAQLVVEAGRPLPQGEYRVRIECVECGAKEVARGQVIGEKTVFLGGDKDDTYDLRLVKYHTELRQLAAKELMMFKQITQSIGAMATDGQHDGVEMQETQKELSLELDRLLKKNQTHEIYYAELLLQIQKLMSMLGTKGAKEVPSFAHSLLQKISELETLPLNSSGMPRKLKY